MLAIQSTHGLQVPLSDESGILLVDEKYVQFVVGLANSKLELNGEKIKKLEKCCETAKLWPSSSIISDEVVSSDEKEVTKVVSKLENTKEDEYREEIVEN